MNIIVSFHTPDPDYSYISNYLRSSLERLKLKHRIRECRSIGTWARNNHRKCGVIAEAHNNGTNGVFWIDADCVVWDDPWPLIESLGPCDVAVGVRHRGRPTEHLFGSMIYFAPTPGAALLLADWKRRCEAGKNEAMRQGWDWKASDQLHLTNAIADGVKGGLRFKELPHQLCFIHDLDRKGLPNPEPYPIIEAFQFSHAGRKKVGRSVLSRPIARTEDSDREFDQAVKRQTRGRKATGADNYGSGPLDETGIMRWDVVSRLINQFHLRDGVEVGVADGLFTAAILERCPSATIAAVDPWTPWAEIERGKWDHEWQYAQVCALRVRFPERLRIFRMTSHKAADYFPPNSIDWVFIDGDHRYPAVKRDLELWTPCVRPGGLIIGHDRLIYGVARALAESGWAINAEPDQVWWLQLPPTPEAKQEPVQGVRG